MLVRYMVRKGILRLGYHARDYRTFQQDEPRYATLKIDLPNLMWFKYRIEVGPTGRYWEFTDAESLRGQLIRAQVFLRDYGIPWLEDPSHRICGQSQPLIEMRFAPCS